MSAITVANVPVEKVIPILALPNFCMLSLWPDFPDFIGFSGKTVCLCCDMSYMALKPSESADSYLVAERSNWEIVRVSTLCNVQSQWCCIDQRCVVPFDSRVPSLITCCGLTVQKNGSRKLACLQPVGGI